MTKAEAMECMFNYSRDVVSPQVAASMVAPWTTLKKLGLEPRKLGQFSRLMHDPKSDEEWAYDVSEVVDALARSLGIEKYYSRMNGAGSSRDDIVKHYVLAIARLDVSRR